MTITGTLVRAGCAAARIPLNLAEGQLLGERRADWPPVLVFETVESSIKQLVGAVTRDDELVQEGRLERAKVAELRKAVELETVAESRREEAAAAHAARVDADEERRQQIQQQKTKRQQTAQRELDAKQQRVEAETTRKRAAARRAEEAAEAEAERRARAEAADRLDAEKAALAKQRRALAAEKRANRVDDQLTATKATRNAAKRSES